MTTTEETEVMTPAEKRALLREILAARSGEAAADRSDDRSDADAAGLDENDRDSVVGGREHVDPDATPPETVADSSDAPLSYSQQRLWILHQLNPTSAAFNVEVVTPIPGVFDPDAMSQALSDVVARHAVLRTRFAETGGEPRQIVDPPSFLEVPRVDLSGMLPQRANAELQALLQREARLPFDLTTGPVMRATIVRVTAYQHVLACYFHHIAVDGWSLGIFGRELTALYSEHVTGLPADLPELTMRYADFAAWQRSWLAGDRLDEQLGFWRDQLRDLPTIELPLDHPRPPVQRDDGACYDFRFPADIAGPLRRLCNAERTTPFITTLAAFATVVSRWSGERDLPIGTYVANRRRPELEPLMGFFLNTVVLRIRAEPHLTFRALLSHVRHTALEAYDHQDVPFELIVDSVQPVRDPSRSPLIQVVFQYNNAPTVEAGADDGGGPFDAKRATSIYDLAVVLFDTAGGIGAQIEYRTALFERETIERLADRFVSVLRAALADPDVAIDRLPLEPPERVRHEWAEINSTGIRHDWEVGIVDLFIEQVEADPDAVALITDDGTVGYGELASRAAAMAAELADRGIGSGDVVGVLLPRSADAAAAILGVVMSGAAWLPIDVDQPPARVETIVRDGGAAVVFVEGADVAGAATLDRDRLIEISSIDRTAAAFPDARPAPNDRAYVLFTSGSTGRPKGVAAPHGQIINRLRWMWREYPWRPGEVAVLTTSLGFVDSIWELFGSLLRGVPTVVVPHGAVADLDGLVDRLGRNRVTRLWLVPSLLRALLDHVDDLADRLPDLDMWVSSGEALSLQLFERFRLALPGASLHNLYGTSEVWDATWCDPSTVALTSGRVPIGDPIDNVRIWVVDGHDQPVPVGVPGELVVGGAGLTFGYLGDADPGRFEVLDVGTGGSPVRVFRTGDRALRRTDGAIELLGRVDAQVKVRGVRVELDEVEAAVASHPLVGGAAVRLVTDGDPHLVAWYERLDPELDARTVRDHTASMLPSAMIPQHFVGVDGLPRTSSGKIDRTALRVEEFAQPMSEPPDGPTETALAAIWCEVLGLGAVGRDDDFFADLGGHSLHATKVVSRARQGLGADIELSALFEHPTIREFAARFADVELDDARRPASSTGSIPRLDREAYRRRPAP